VCRPRIAHHLEVFQLTGTGRPAQMQALAQVHSALAKGIPASHLLSLPRHAPVDFEPSRLIDGGLSTLRRLSYIFFPVMLHAGPLPPAASGARRVPGALVRRPRNRSPRGAENCSPACRHRAG